MLRKLLFICFIFLLSYEGETQLVDSLRTLFKKKYSIDTRLESRNSFIDPELTSVNGVRLGLAFQRKLKLGFGVSWLKTPVSKRFYPQNEFGKIDTVKKYLKFMYLCFYADFVFYKTKRWQLSVPIQLGMGSVWHQQNRVYAFGVEEKKYPVVFYEPGITMQFKVLRWMGAGADVAYRFALQNANKTYVQLSSPSLSFKALFWFDQLFYELFPKSAITKQYGPCYW